MKHTKEQLIEIICKNNNKEVVLEAWKLGKDKFYSDDLREICEYCKIEDIAKEAWELGKNKFNSDDLRYICKYCKFEDIVNECKEKLKPFNPKEIKIEDL